MKISTYLSAGGAILLAFGLGFLLIPQVLNPIYGLPAEPHNLLQSRYFAAAFIAYGLTIWFMRHIQDDGTLRALLISNAIGDALGGGISLWAYMSGLQNAMVLGPVLLYAGFGLGALYFLGSPARRMQQAGAA